MAVTKLDPPEMSPHDSPFSHIVLHAKSGLAFLSGQTPVDSDGDLVGENDAAAQVEQVFENIGTALSSLGENWASVLSLTTYLTSQDHMPAFRETRQRLFAEYFPYGQYPAHTLLIVAGLGSAEHFVEIEAVISHESGERS